VTAIRRQLGEHGMSTISYGEAPDTVTPDSHDIGIPRDTQGDVARAAGYLLVKPVMPRVTQTETKAAH
jgi:hypothetical protein